MTGLRVAPEEALARLMLGNQRFVQQRLDHLNRDFARIEAVAEHQEPFAAILSCADSRVIPEVLFDQGIGDIFVIRVAGNLAMMDTVASAEYAIAMLGVSVLMVLGHERCGAVKATLAGGSFPGIISTLAESVAPALKATQSHTGDRLTNVIQANVHLQLERLSRSTVVKAAMTRGELRLVGAYYDLDTAEVQILEERPDVGA
ncbi:carbonic anhydrase [Thermosynechococcaceae cyanobacterium Okahandja]